MKLQTWIAALILTVAAPVVQTNQQCESEDGRIGWCVNLETADDDLCGDGWQISDDVYDDCPPNVRGLEDVSTFHFFFFFFFFFFFVLLLSHQFPHRN